MTLLNFSGSVRLCVCRFQELFLVYFISHLPEKVVGSTKETKLF